MPDDLDDARPDAPRGPLDAATVEALLERHLPELRRWIRYRAGRLVSQKESASDLAQSVCREIIEHIDRFEHGSEDGFRRWLFRTAERKMVSRFRYYAAEKRQVSRDVSGSDDVPRELLFHTPSRDAIAREELHAAERAFAKLPEHYRQAITLSRVRGLSHAEIAVVMGRSEGAVRNLVYRGLAMIAEELGDG